MKLPLFAAMPDELAASHAGRVGLFYKNPINKYQQRVLIATLADQISKGDRCLPLPWQLATISGMSRTEYVWTHTMLPIQRATEHRNNPIPHGSEANPSLVTRSGTQSKKLLRLCPECAQEDLTKNPYSWFRRIHNLHGIELCIIHDISLCQPDKKQNFYRMPHQHINNTNISKATLPKLGLEEKNFQKRLCESHAIFLERDRPFRSIQLNRAIIKKAKDLSIYGNQRKKTQENLISEYIYKRTPTRWSQQYWRYKQSQRPCTIDTLPEFTIEGTTPRIKELLYALAFATLFESNEETKLYIAQSDENA